MKFASASGVWSQAYACGICVFLGYSSDFRWGAGDGHLKYASAILTQASV